MVNPHTTKEVGTLDDIVPGTTMLFLIRLKAHYTAFLSVFSPSVAKVLYVATLYRVLRIPGKPKECFRLAE